MNFLIDSSLSPLVAEQLRLAGHDSIQVRRYGIHKADDEVVFARAAEEYRVLVSADTNFASILAARQAVKPSVILFRPANAQVLNNLKVSAQRGLGIALARRPDFTGAPRHKSFHLAPRAMSLELLLEDPVNFAIFILVLDLPTAFLHAPVGILAAAAAAFIKAHVTGAERKIPGARRSRVKMLMIAVVAGHGHHRA